MSGKPGWVIIVGAQDQNFTKFQMDLLSKVSVPISSSMMLYEIFSGLPMLGGGGCDYLWTA